jgi:hypothetical protein
MADSEKNRRTGCAERQSISRTNDNPHPYAKSGGGNAAAKPGGKFSDENPSANIDNRPGREGESGAAVAVIIRTKAACCPAPASPNAPLPGHLRLTPNVRCLGICDI